MRLADVVQQDLKRQNIYVDDSEIMLLRHSNGDVDAMRSYGATVEEHTFVQPTVSRYDYLEVGASVVVVIVYDQVYGLYRVIGIDEEGTMDSLASHAYRQFRKARQKPKEPGRRFKMSPIPCSAIGATITGWSAPRTPVARSDGKRKLFWKIKVNILEAGVWLPDRKADRNGWENDTKYTPQEGDWRKTVERQIRERRGQQQFRDAVRNRHGDRCMVTGCDVLDVLEAAHINPYRGEDDNHPENGLLLRTDIHTLFDLDLLGIDPDRLRIEMHSKLAKNKEYGKLAGKPLKCARDRRPSQEALRLRYDQFQQRLRELL